MSEVVTGEHSSNFANSLRAKESADARRGRIADDALLDHEMMMSTGRNRCQVRHGNDLLRATHFAQTLANVLSDLSPEPCVDLVKDGDDVVVHRLERQRE